MSSPPFDGSRRRAARPAGFFLLDAPLERHGPVRLRIGDVVQVAALGCRLAETVDDVPVPVEVIGPLTGGVLTSSDAILPAGSPNAVFVVARRAGRATLELTLGPARERPTKAVVSINVER